MEKQPDGVFEISGDFEDYDSEGEEGLDVKAEKTKEERINQRQV